MIGNAIRQERKKANLTLEELAKRVGCGKSYIWELENGKIKNPSFDKINRISLSLNIDLETLTGYVSTKARIELEIEVMRLFRALDENEKVMLVNIMKKYIKGK
jgi:transcriptional regulator with XRE-family HTH domain